MLHKSPSDQRDIMKRNISVTVVCLLLFILVFSDKVQAQRLFVLVAADTADNNISDAELGYYEPFPTDHLIKINDCRYARLAISTMPCEAWSRVQATSSSS